MVFLENDIGNTGSFLGGDTCVHGRTIASAPGLYRDQGSGAGVRSGLAVGGVEMGVRGNQTHDEHALPGLADRGGSGRVGVCGVSRFGRRAVGPDDPQCPRRESDGHRGTRTASPPCVGRRIAEGDPQPGAAAGHRPDADPVSRLAGPRSERDLSRPAEVRDDALSCVCHGGRAAPFLMNTGSSVHARADARRTRRVDGPPVAAVLRRIPALDHPDHPAAPQSRPAPGPRPGNLSTRYSSRLTKHILGTTEFQFPSDLPVRQIQTP